MLIKAQDPSRLLHLKLGSPGTSEIIFGKLHNHLCTGRMKLNWNVYRKELEGSLGSDKPFNRFKKSSLFSLAK